MVAKIALIVLVTAAIYSIAVVGLNIQWGDTGLLNFGLAAFFGIGAYTSILLTTAPPSGSFFDRTVGYTYPLVIGLIGAFVVAAVVGAVVATSTTRVSGDYLAVVTLAFDQIVRNIATQESWLTSGHAGISETTKIFPGSVVGTELKYLALVAVFVGLAYFTFRRLSRSAFGRTLHAIREDPNVPKVLGKDTRLFNYKAFAFGAGLQGISGALMAHYLGFFSPAVFPLTITFILWTALIIGGSGSYKGAIAGAVVIMVLHQAVRYVPSDIPLSAELPHIRTILLGIALIAVLYYRPYGIFGDAERLSAGGKSL